MLKKFTILVLIAVSCTKDDAKPVTISEIEIKIKYDQTHQYSLKQGSKNVDNSVIRWEVNDKFVGSINATGYFKARKVGVTHINAVTGWGITQGNVIVEPYSNLVIEPHAKFAATISDIKYIEKRKLIKATDDGLVYQGENNKLETIIYLFYPDLKLKVASIIFKPISSVATEVGEYYRERYPDFSITDKYVICYDDDKSKIVGLSATQTLGLSAIYVQTPAGLRSTESFEKSVMKDLEKFVAKNMAHSETDKLNALLSGKKK